MRVEFKLYPVGRGYPVRVQGCDRVYNALGDSDWKQYIRTGVSKL